MLLRANAIECILEVGEVHSSHVQKHIILKSNDEEYIVNISKKPFSFEFFQSFSLQSHSFLLSLQLAGRSLSFAILWWSLPLQFRRLTQQSFRYLKSVFSLLLLCLPGNAYHLGSDRIGCFVLAAAPKLPWRPLSVPLSPPLSLAIPSLPSPISCLCSSKGCLWGASGPPRTASR